MKIKIEFPGKRRAFSGLLVFLTVTAVSCKENYTPRPYGYHRIDFPEKEYRLLSGNMPYTFYMATEASIEPDRSPDAEPYWIDIKYPAYNATVNLSYKTLQSDTSLAGFEQDCHRLAYAHTVKAESIKEQYFRKANGIFGLLYLIEGNAASSTQFFVTDSVKHFLRGSLYFQNRPNKDSLAPVIEHLRRDIVKLMETVEFSGTEFQGKRKS